MTVCKRKLPANVIRLVVTLRLVQALRLLLGR